MNIYKLVFFMGAGAFLLACLGALPFDQKAALKLGQGSIILAAFGLLC